MNVASLELSRELEYLSGWGDTENVWYYAFAAGDPTIRDWELWPMTLSEGELPKRVRHAYDTKTPAYDLGYLLRKLQHHPVIYLNQIHGRRWKAENVWGKISTEMKGAIRRYEEFEIADSPEDALCRLAIKLFEKGILPGKEESL